MKGGGLGRRGGCLLGLGVGGEERGRDVYINLTKRQEVNIEKAIPKCHTYGGEVR